MKRKITFLTAALALLAFLALPMGMRGQTTVASFVREGTTNTTTGGDFTTTFSAKTGYYQDANGDCYMQILNTNAYWTETPTSISFAAKLGGGTGNHDLSASVYVSLLDVDGEVIDGTETEVTSHITTNTGDDYTISIPVVNNAYGVKLSHEKENGYNVRYYSFSLSYVGDGGTPIPTTYTVTYNCNGGSDCPDNVTGIDAGTTIYLADGPVKDGYEFSGWSDGNTIYDENDEYTVNSNVTFTAQWTEQNSGDVHWVLTNLADLTENDVFVIVGNNGSNYAMKNSEASNSGPVVVEVTVSGSELTGTIGDDIRWNISGNATNGYIFYPNGSSTTWLYCIDNNNGLRIGSGNTDYNTFVIQNNYIYNTGRGRYVGIYSNTNWRSYTSINSNIANQTFGFYKKVTGGVIPPSITVTNPEEIAYDATEGSFNFTVNNPVDDATLSVSEEVEWIDEAAINTTNDGYSVTFIITQNEAGAAREGIITLTYAYGDNQTVSQNVTVSQAGDPNAVMTITEVRTQGTGNVVTKGVVTSITGSNNKTAYIQDASAAIVVYGNFTAAVGDEIRVSGTLQDYNGLLEITSPTVTVISSGNTTNPELMTIAEAVASTNQGWYIRIENATVTAISGSGSSQNTTIAQGQNTIVVRGNLGTSVAVNDVISGLDGNIGYYNTANQIANPQNVTVQENLLPSVTITPATINAPAAGVSDVLTVAYENIYSVEGVVFVDADDVEITYDWITANLNNDNNVAYTVSPNDGVARTAYLKVLAFDENLDDVFSNTVTVNQAEYVAPPTDYAELPFSFNGGRADIENTDGLTQEGLDTDYGTNYPTTKLKFNTTGDWLILHFNEQPGIFKFDIMGTGTSFSGTFTVETSADGVDYETLATYTELGDAETMTFDNLDANVRYIRWYFTEKVSGCNVGVGDIHLYEYGYVPVPEAFITVNPDEVNVNAEQHDGTLDLAYENLAITDMYDFNIQYYDAQGEEIDEPDWMEALVAEQDPEIGEGYVASYWIMENEGTEARTAYFKVYVGETFSNLVTVNQAAPVIPPTPGSGIYVRVTSLDQLTDGSKVIIAARYDEELTNGYFAMPGETSGKPTGVAFTSETSGNDEILPATITDSEDTYYWTVNVTNDGYTFTNAEDQKIGYSSSTNFATNNNTVWTITRETAAETAMVAEYTGFVIRNGNTNTRAFAFAGEKFGAYSTSNMGGNYNFYLDFFVESMPSPANSIVIEGYENNPNPNGGWYLIASPFAVDPDDVPGMTQGDFDLYSFTDMEEAEWRNYEAEGGHFNLELGKGYLYAHKTGVTLTFDGEPYTGDGEITLTRNENNTGAYQGWNLVGNPFTETAYIEVDRDFYVMNEAGTNVVLNESNNRTIAPMQGIFVKAEQDGETMKFLTEGTATAGDIDQKIVMNVRKDRNMVIDRAMIRFGEGRQLPKFMFNPNDTKLYIAKDNEEFAVVRSIDENSTPISFRAAEDGTYTLSVNVENVEMEYLHLIDNMTSADIDLLATPSYTFDARTTDYANRFNLVYFTYDDVKENNVQPFAFFNGSEWVINNEGSATLQVIDVTGRMLSSETFNGNARISLDQVPGVYMMRLVSGNDVKVQKVIIK